MVDSILAAGSISITDINDSIITTDGVPPRNPIDGMLWIDKSDSKSVLKVYQNGSWSTQHLDTTSLDPELSETIESILTSLGSMADDGQLDFANRSTLAMEIAEIIGQVPSRATGNVYTNSLPDYTVLDSQGVGTFASVRRTYRDVEGDTSASEYIALQQAYTALNSYLSGHSLKPWDITRANRDRVVTISDPDLFRTRFLEYFLAELALSSENERLAIKRAEEYTERLTDGSSVVDKGVEEGNGGDGVYSEVSDDSVVHVEIEGDTWQAVDSGALNMVPTHPAYWEAGHYATNGAKEPYGGRIRVRHLIEIRPNTRYYFRSGDSNYNFVIRGYSSGKVLTRNWGVPNANGSVVESNANERFIGVTIYTNNTEMPAEDILSRLDEQRLRPLISEDSSNSDRVWERYATRNVTPYSPSYLFSPQDPLELFTSQGGANLLFNSNNQASTTGNHIAFPSTNSGLVRGETYTFSFDIRSDGADHITSVFLNNSNHSFIPNTEIGTEWRRLSFSFVWQGGTYNNREIHPHVYPRPVGSQTTVRNWSLVKGTTNGLWSPNPEDLEDNERTDEAYRTFLHGVAPLRKVGNIADRLYRDDESGRWMIERNIGVIDSSHVSQMRDRGANNANSYKIFDIENVDFRQGMNTQRDLAICSHFRNDGYASDIADMQTFTREGMAFFTGDTRNVYFVFDRGMSIAQFRSWWEENNVEVQYVKQEPEIETLWQSPPESSSEQEEWEEPLSNEMHRRLENIPSYKNGTYVYLLLPEDTGVNPTIHTTFKSRGWLERRDTQAGLDNAATKDELNSVESSLVSTFSTNIEETAEGILQSVSTSINDLEGHLQEFIGSQISQTNESWELLFTNLSNDIGNTSSSISAIESWFHIRNDGNTIYLELGDSRSANTIRMYPDRLSFMSGNGEVAYVSDQTLRITQGIFVESAQIGKHRIATVSGTDFTAINYVGGG